MKRNPVLLMLCVAALLFVFGGCTFQSSVGSEIEKTPNAPPALAHEHGDHHKGDGHHGAHHEMPMACNGTFVSKEEAAVPDLSDDVYREIRTVLWETDTDIGHKIFTYVFYADLRSPGEVVAMTARADGTPLTWMTWQENDAMKTVFLEVNERVCVKLIVTKSDGTKLDLANFMRVLVAASEKNAK